MGLRVCQRHNRTGRHKGKRPSSSDEGHIFWHTAVAWLSVGMVFAQAEKMFTSEHVVMYCKMGNGETLPDGDWAAHLVRSQGRGASIWDVSNGNTAFHGAPGYINIIQRGRDDAISAICSLSDNRMAGCPNPGVAGCPNPGPPSRASGVIEYQTSGPAIDVQRSISASGVNDRGHELHVLHSPSGKEVWLAVATSAATSRPSADTTTTSTETGPRSGNETLLDDMIEYRLAVSLPLQQSMF